MHYADSHIHEKSKQAIKEFDFQTMEDVVTRLRIVNDELNKVNGDVRRLSLSKIAEEARERRSGKRSRSRPAQQARARAGAGPS